MSPHVPVADLAERFMELSRQLRDLRARASREGMVALIGLLAPADGVLVRAGRAVEAAKGGDLDALETARRLLVELDRTLADAEAELARPELDRRTRLEVGSAMSWIAELGTAEERSLARASFQAAERARAAKNALEVQRQVQMIHRLGGVAWMRSPGAWERELDGCGARVVEATDVARVSPRRRGAARHGEG